ncbi:MAG: hypothetical protein FWE88_01570 [Phycisphaerae bacterium]|nr:hypothetical protein [Phycisphaerae bacterium]
MKIPAFTNDGLLPPGEYEVSFEELRKSVLVLGPGDLGEFSLWGSEWRRLLVNNLEILTRQLWQVGVREVFVDGSFAEDNNHPGDIDGYFVCEPGSLHEDGLQKQLNALDPYKIWEWNRASRTSYPGYKKPQLPMWHRYRVELHPYVPESGLDCGIYDGSGRRLEFPSAFRQSRDGKPKGIIKLRYGGEP